jgi:hypothetical protein
MNQTHDQYFLNEQKGRCQAIRQMSSAPLNGILYFRFENPYTAGSLTDPERMRDILNDQTAQIMDRLKEQKTPKIRHLHLSSNPVHIEKGREISIAISFSAPGGSDIIISDIMELLSRAGFVYTEQENVTSLTTKWRMTTIAKNPPTGRQLGRS